MHENIFTTLITSVKVKFVCESDYVVRGVNLGTGVEKGQKFGSHIPRSLVQDRRRRELETILNMANPKRLVE